MGEIVARLRNIWGSHVERAVFEPCRRSGTIVPVV